MEILAQGPVAKAVLALSIVAAVGLVFGSLGVRGIRLGAAGALFAGNFFWTTRHAYRRTHSRVRQRFWPLEIVAAHSRNARNQCSSRSMLVRSTP